MFKNAAIDGVLVRPVKRFTDSRGWLSELFREDQLDQKIMPVMSYISETLPGVQRGPHEHVAQTDYFVFLGPGDFRVVMWDSRPKSPTLNHKMDVICGASNAQVVVVPEGVVHTYQNVSDHPGIVLNFPNKLYAGKDYKEEVDEIRHEDDPESPYKIES